MVRTVAQWSLGTLNVQRSDATTTRCAMGTARRMRGLNPWAADALCAVCDFFYHYNLLFRVAVHGRDTCHDGTNGNVDDSDRGDELASLLASLASSFVQNRAVDTNATANRQTVHIYTQKNVHNKCFIVATLCLVWRTQRHKRGSTWQRNSILIRIARVLADATRHTQRVSRTISQIIRTVRVKTTHLTAQWQPRIQNACTHCARLLSHKQNWSPVVLLWLR